MRTLPNTLAPRFATVILWCTTLLALHGCEDREDARGGTDLFQLAIDEAPGGALLSAWVDPDAAIEPIAYVAGGYVGVARADVADGNLGRLLRYEGGAFVTVCRTPQVLWWVQGGLDGTVVAAGQDGIVLRYREDDRSCDVSYVDGDWPTGLPTLWGLYGASADDVRFVGGSVAPDGPKGVILHWDGATYTREPVPESAELNLFKIAHADDRLYVVGDGGTILRRLDTGTGEWLADPPVLLGVDSTLFTDESPAWRREQLLSDDRGWRRDRQCDRRSARHHLGSREPRAPRIHTRWTGLRGERHTATCARRWRWSVGAATSQRMTRPWHAAATAPAVLHSQPLETRLTACSRCRPCTGPAQLSFVRAALLQALQESSRSSPWESSCLTRDDGTPALSFSRTRKASLVS